MTRSPGRGPFGLTLRRCLRAAAPATAAALLAALALRRLQAGDAAVEPTPGANSPWLALPLGAAAFATAFAAVRFWPAFGRNAAGAGWVDRLHRGRLGGCGAALAAALAVQALLTTPVALLLPDALGAPAQAFAAHALTPIGDGLLDRSHPRLALRCAADAPVGELRLRPLVGMPDDGWQGASLRVLADGEPLGALPTAIADTRQPARLTFAPRRVAVFTLVYESGGVPLGFDADAAVAIGAAPCPRWQNAVAAVALALAPAFLALALGALVGQVARRATALATAGAVLFLGTIGGQGPFLPALVGLLRGEWLWTAAVFQLGAPSLAVGCAAMIAAMFLRAKARR